MDFNLPPMQHTRFFHFLLICAALLTFACGDDETNPNEDLNNRLEGDWEVESFIGIGGSGSVELIGNSYSSINLDFEKQGPADGEYVFTFISTPNFGGSTAVVRGDYEIENNGTEITLMPDDNSGDEEYDIEIDDDDLEMDGLFTFDTGAIRAQIEAMRD